MEDFILKIIGELICLASIIFSSAMYCVIWYLLDLPMWTVNIVGLLIVATVPLAFKILEEF